MPLERSSVIHSAFHKPKSFFDDAQYIRQHLNRLGIITDVIHEMEIAIGGGGLKCSTVPAALVAMFEKYGVLYPEIMKVGSGAAGTAVNFISQQFHRMIKVWLHELSDDKFISFNEKRVRNTIIGLLLDILKLQHNSNWPRIMNVRHLVKNIINNKTLDWSTFKNSPTKLIIRATDRLYGEIISMSNHEGEDHQFESPDDLDEGLIMSKAAAVASGEIGDLKKPGLRNGMDTEISAHTAKMILEAIEEGRKKVVAFTTFNAEDPDNLLYKVWRFFQHPCFKRSYRDTIRAMHNLRKRFANAFTHGGIFSVEKTDVCIVQLDDAKLSMLDNSPEASKIGMYKGYNAVMNSEALKDFMDDVKTNPLNSIESLSNKHQEDTPVPFTIADIS